tara:strand:- start:1714 stop:2010 length:297 start_codon:yes stop_codon:yes gene_type:complete
MRVNISYSLELEDVPEEVQRLLIECDKKIRAIHGDLVEVTDRDPLEIIKQLDIIRIKMAETDLQLNDCMQILIGYVQTLSRLPELNQGTEPPQEKEDE